MAINRQTLVSYHYPATRLPIYNSKAYTWKTESSTYTTTSVTTTTTATTTSATSRYNSTPQQTQSQKPYYNYSSYYSNDYKNDYTKKYAPRNTNTFTNNYRRHIDEVINSYDKTTDINSSYNKINDLSSSFSKTSGYSSYNLSNSFNSNDKNDSINATKSFSINTNDNYSSNKNSVYDLSDKNNRELLPVNRSSDLGVYFTGENFGLLTDHIQIKDSFSVSFQFRTTAANGLIMILVNQHTNDAFFIELVDSQLRATLFINGEPDSAWSEFSSKILSNYVWVDVDIKITGHTIHMEVRDKKYIKTHRNFIDVPIFGDFFIGGHPASIQPPYAVRSKKFFNGEIKHLKVNNQPISWYGPPNNLTARLRKWDN